MVHNVSLNHPELARRALQGLRVFQGAPRTDRPGRTVIAQSGRVQLFDGGGANTGDVVVLVPSLINPADVLDLAPGNSLVEHLANNGFRPLLVDWGVPTPQAGAEGIDWYIERHLVPLLRALGARPHLIGYCLGGTMALAAACLLDVRSLTLLASPWHFARYAPSARQAAAAIWEANRGAVNALGLMPLEILQTLFWALDAERTVAKYAALADRADDHRYVQNFVALEDWNNGGAPLTAAVAHDIFERFMAADTSGMGDWSISGVRCTPENLRCGTVRHFTAMDDAIAPAQTAPDGVHTVALQAGHVGMLVGRKAPDALWRELVGSLRA